MPNNIKQLRKISAVLVLALAILPGCSVRHKDAKGYFLSDEKITVEDLKIFWELKFIDIDIVGHIQQI